MNPAVTVFKNHQKELDAKCNFDSLAADAEYMGKVIEVKDAIVKLGRCED